MRHVSVQQLSAFLDGALVGVSRELVTRHLASCASCRERHAAWRVNDDALRRVLSWEPDERTFEEWSSRVELTLTAERKGLPPPEFSELQHPVIAAPEPPAERLDQVVQSVRRTRRGTPARAPATPAPQALVPATPAPPVAPEPAPAPEPAEVEPVATTPPEVVATAPAEAAHAEGESVAAEPAPTSPPWSEVELPPVERAPEPPRQRPQLVHARVHDPGPPAERLPESRPVPALKVVHSPTPAAALAAEYGRVRARAAVDRRPILTLVSLLAVLVIAGSPLVPEVIRIPLPERWRWRLPRVEFVRRTHDVTPTRSSIPPVRLATSAAVEPELVKPTPIAAPVESVSTAVRPATPGKALLASDAPAEPVRATAPAATLTESPVLAYAPITEPPRPAAKPATRAVKPARTAPARAVTATPAPARAEKPATPAEKEPVPSGQESPGTIVPVKITTTVEPVRAPAPATPPPAPAPAPATPESEEDWPLLCGTVLDAAGGPLEGARVVLAANALAVRTDKRGRFCVACPPGTQGLRIEAAGHDPHTRTVELASGMVEIRVSLTASR